MAKMNLLVVVCAVWMIGVAYARIPLGLISKALIWDYDHPDVTKTLEYARPNVQEFAPTNVVAPQFQTKAPSEEGLGQQYVQTVYKATDRKILGNTVEPLMPSYEVEYQILNFTTVGMQNLSTSSVEFSKVLNSTKLYMDISNRTHNVAPTFYQTLDFQTQKIHYTATMCTTADTKTMCNTTTPMTVTETNALPFL